MDTSIRHSIRSIKRGCAALAAGALLAAPAYAQSPAPAPAAAVRVTFAGQLLDVRNGYAYFTSGDACRISAAVRISDAATGAAAPAPHAKAFVRATVDPATGTIVAFAISKQRLAVQPGDAKSCAVAPLTAEVPAPELNQGRGKTGKPVPVTFYVQVPPTTALTESVYMTTDASGWIPNAIKLDRVDALHYRLTRVFASGTKFAYRYTRGSWNSVERGQDLLEPPPHQFLVNEVDAARHDDIVYHWSDESGTAQQAGPNGIPTPFNANPFGNQPGLPTGMPQPSRTLPPPTPAPKKP
ncbi:MAG: hypothetical protein ABR591_04470 [Candidatus Velthaea sp.]